MEDQQTKFVVFLDSLGPDDVENHTHFIKKHCYDGTLDAGNPYVTPSVMGSIYTGEDPATHGLPSVSRYEQEGRTRPAAPTMPEIVAEDDTYGNVLQFGLPFIVPPKAEPTGEYWSISNAMGQQVFSPQQAGTFLQIPGPVGELDNPDDDGGRLWNHRRDMVRSTFATARSLADAQEFDVVFISCRLLDSYCHYRFTEPEDAELTDRQFLLKEVIDPEIDLLMEFGDVFVFGDHGAMEMDNIFRINRWMMEKGYLDVEIDEEQIQWAIEEGIMEDPDKQGPVRQIGMPGVRVNEENSIAVSDDPFSTGVTLLDGAEESEVKSLISELEDQDGIERVDWAREMWDGPLIDECPDLYPYRTPGTFVSGNVAEEMGGVEVIRTGVHHPTGAWGGSTDFNAPDEVTPEELFHVIMRKFLNINPDDHGGDSRDYAAAMDEEDDAAVKERLRDMGYL